MHMKQLWNEFFHLDLFLIVFVIATVQLILYIFIFFFHSSIAFNKQAYLYSFHHFLDDPRSQEGKFSFLRSIAYGDSQWYLKIADEGYPNYPTNIDIFNKNIMDGVSYTFFPLYPLLIWLIHLATQNIEIAAFLLTQFLFIANTISIYWIVTKVYSAKVAKKLILLLFLFPYSIFYRGFYAEGLFLFLLLWFSYFLLKSRWIFSASFLSLLLVTKGTAYFLPFVFAGYFFASLKKEKNYFKPLIILGVLAFPFLLWVIFNYLKTGSAFYFFLAQSQVVVTSPVIIFFINMGRLLLFPYVPFYLEIDIFVFVLATLLLILSFKKLPRKLWWISFALYLLPITVKDIGGFSRYQIASFPLFLYLVLVLKKKYYSILIGLFTVGLLLVALLFVNWYWIG